MQNKIYFPFKYKTRKRFFFILQWAFILDSPWVTGYGEVMAVVFGRKIVFGLWKVKMSLQTHSCHPILFSVSLSLNRNVD